MKISNASKGQLKYISSNSPFSKAVDKAKAELRSPRHRDFEDISLANSNSTASLQSSENESVLYDESSQTQEGMFHSVDDYPAKVLIHDDEEILLMTCTN